jgi:hypothetical protein
LNKDKLTGQKPPLKIAEIWAIRTWLQMSSNVPELVPFNLAIDSKLRACDPTRLRVRNICQASHVGSRATVTAIWNLPGSAPLNNQTRFRKFKTREG